MKVLVDAETKRLLGAAILGIERRRGGARAARLDGRRRGRASVLARTMHIHPTVSELLPTLLQQLKPLPAA